MRGEALVLVTCDECGEEVSVEIPTEFSGELEDFVSSELRVWYDWGSGNDGDLCPRCAVDKIEE